MLSSLSQIPSPPLDWKDRPSVVKDKIIQCWEKLSTLTESTWSYNGNKTYAIVAQMQELALIKAIIKDNPERTEFSVLDIGAGKFQLGRTLAQGLNEANDIPKHVRVNIISVRGEANPENEEVQDGICHLYELGAFKIEDISSELTTRIKLHKPIDFAISAWTFRHLVDPFGTFLQVYNLLNPKSGHFILDGFFYERESKDGIVSDCPRRNMLSLLQDLSEPFLIHGYNYCSGRDVFNPIILKRMNNNECKIPLSYVDLGRGRINCGSGCTIKFKELELPTIIESEGRELLAKFKGDKDLYDFLVKNSVFDITRPDTGYIGPVAPRIQKSSLVLPTSITANSNQNYEVQSDAKQLIFTAKNKRKNKTLIPMINTQEPVAYRTRSKAKLKSA